MNEYSGQDVGTQRRSHQTEPKASVLTGRSKFPMSHRFPTSMRYGEISPFYYQHGIGDDTIPLYSEHTLRTHTLSSPVESDVEMQKTYFSVPMDAIYPLNWERMQVSPSHGDDVPDDTRCCFSMINHLRSAHTRFVNLINTYIDGDISSNYLTYIINHVVLLESVFSNGSLFAQFNMHFAPLISFINETGSSETIDFDDWLDKFYPSFFKNFIYTGDDSPYFVVDNVKYGYTGEIVGDSFTSNGIRFVNLHQLLDLVRHDRFSIVNATDISTDSLVDGTDFEDIRTLTIQAFSQPINLEVIFAYQLGCFQYFSDSRIDDIFDASRFRGLLNSLFRTMYGNAYPRFFSYNGETLQYDIFSGRNFNSLFSNLSDSSVLIDGPVMGYIFDVCKLVFSFRNSLRFGDYFITARLRQYGVGDTTIDTSSGSVSALEITKNLQWQRFLQSVSWAKQTVKDYARDVLGIQKYQTPRKDVPMFIASDRFRIDGYEVENTGSEQRDVNSITTLVKTKQGKFAFEFGPENQCIVIGVMHFDVERIYSKGLDRMHTHANRYDDIIPEMQFIGDQEIRKNEFDVSLGDGVFGWTLRYMPYKIRTNYAAGAFVNHLKSWMMVTDNKDGNSTTGSIDSRYIRSTPAEFDRFYTSLTGCSLATYYHFMVVNRNYQELTRDLVYAPEPLK